MKKRNLLLLPLFMLVLAGCTKPPVASSEEPPVTSTEPITDDSEELPSVSEEPPTSVDETVITPIKDARPKEGTAVTVQGVATAVYGMSGGKFGAILQQDDHAITLPFLLEADLALFAIGDVVQASGTIKTFNGLIQLDTPTVKKVDVTMAAPVAHVLTTWDQAAMEGMDARWVKVEGLQKVGGVIDPTKNSPIDVKFPGEATTFQLYMSGYIATADKEALATKINDMGSTDTINFEGPLGRFNNFQLNPVNEATVTIVKGEPPVGPVAPTALAFSPASKLLKGAETFQTTLVPTPGDATLDGLVYASSDEAVATVSATGLITAVAPGLADITATVGTVVGTFKVEVIPANATVIASPATSTNMTPSVNEAEKFGFVPADIYIAAEKGSASTVVGLYADLRLYGNRADGNGNLLSVYVPTGKMITSISIDFGATTNGGTAEFKHGDQTVALTNEQVLNVRHEVNSIAVNGFSIKNNLSGGTSNPQIRINKILLVIEDGTPTSVLPGQPSDFTPPAPVVVEPKTIAQFLAEADGFEAIITGVITNLGPYNSFTIEDATGATHYRVSGKNAASNPLGFAVGDKVTAHVKKATFNGLLQAEFVADQVVVAGPVAFPNTAVALTSVLAADLLPNSGRRVSGELTVVSYSADSYGTKILVLTDGTNEVDLKLDNRLPNYVQFDYVATLVAGDIVILDGAVISVASNTPLLVADNAAQLVKKTV